MEKLGVTGIVLAGGRSSRMGTDKSLMLLHGKPIISHVIEAIKPLCDQVVISSNKSVYDFTGCDVWPDLYPIQAPMIGIYSCLKRSTTDLNIVVSCDIPFVETALFTNLLQNMEGSDIIVPVHDNYVEPLCAIYKKKVVPALQQFIDQQNYRLFEFVEHMPHRRLEINPSTFSKRIFLNINTMDDFDCASNNL
ncbi:MAG TPA: molybdenum cofactor guanylyltransferase [Bacteroidales bacterium]|nr:molybdenum cofactor guanylyltransferase [Bacteroidales bacterium]